MTDKFLDAVSVFFPLTYIDPEKFSKIKAGAMTFKINRYYAKGIGNISVINGSAMLGLMKMDTVIINPFERDLPLLSYDRIFVMGNDTLLIELYDTLLSSCNLNAFQKAEQLSTVLPNHPLGSHWYDNIRLPQSVSKRGKKKYTPLFDTLTLEFINAYIATALSASECNTEQKRKKASEYTEGLLANGGPSTDAFKKHLGKNKTETLFREILFATGTPE